MFIIKKVSRGEPEVTLQLLHLTCDTKLLRVPCFVRFLRVFPPSEKICSRGKKVNAKTFSARDRRLSRSVIFGEPSTDFISLHVAFF